MAIIALRGELHIFKEFTPRKLTYELRSQEKKKKSIRQIQHKQTPHTTLQKLSPKKSWRPLMSVTENASFVAEH